MKRFGFTLSEILITLGIIGIVAAMTVPTVISKYSTSEYSARAKKAYGLLSTVSEEAWRASGSTKMTIDSVEKAFNDTLRYKNGGSCLGYPVYYLNGSQAESNICRTKVYLLPDGTRILRDNSFCIYFWIDVNGKKGPNTYGKDIYKYMLCADNPMVKPFDDGDCSTSGHGTGCSKRLMRNGWEIDW